ncbi:MAG: methyltransferase [Bauldia sp.]|nr:methyltransferase [Bauldia sp.]
MTTATTDAFLGGLVTAIQPATGHHRAGLEAVLLAASVPAEARGRALDLGAGAGIAGFGLAARCQALAVTLVEREAALVDAANASLALAANAGFAARVSVAALDIEAPEPVRLAAGVAREAADLVVTNPPFHDPDAVRASPAQPRAGAHILPAGLDPWFRFAAWALQPGGALVAILAAAMLTDALTALRGRFGGVAVLPVHPRPDMAALRVMLHATKGSRAATTVLPGLVLHGAAGKDFAPEVARLLRGETDLPAIHPAWQRIVAGSF